MLKIRLQKIGKKNDPSYRIALVEHTTSPHGKFIELLGSYSPKLKQKQINKERIGYWLTKGAQASPTVHNLLVEEKIINAEKVKSWKPKKKKGEVPPAGATPTEAGAEAPKVEAAPETAKTEENSKEEIKTEEVKPEPAVIEETKPVEEMKPEVPPESGETPNLDIEPKKD